MEYLVGLLLALAVSVFAALVGFDRDRAFYPAVTIVIASYYGLFAVMGGSVQVLLLESIAIAAFMGLAVLGFKRNLWLVVGALLAHGIFDFFHGHIVMNTGVPIWWPMFCLTYDIMAAACLAWLLKRSRIAVYAP
jgi:hypothetical protein